MNTNKQFQIGIIGSAGSDDYQGAEGATAEMLASAEIVGRLLAEKQAIVVTGGKSGIMEASARGATSAGGTTIGVINGSQRFTSNAFTNVEVLSGMQADGFDEFLLVMMCDAFIAIGGGAGTLEEIAIAYRNNKPVVALSPHNGWAKQLAGTYLDERKRVKIQTASTPEQAVETIFNQL